MADESSSVDAGDTAAPVNAGQTSVNNNETAASLNNAQTPGNSEQASGNNTQTPVNCASPPLSNTLAPVDSTSPVNTPTPVDSTSPAINTPAPVDSTTPVSSDGPATGETDAVTTGIKHVPSFRSFAVTRIEESDIVRGGRDGPLSPDGSAADAPPKDDKDAPPRDGILKDGPKKDGILKGTSSRDPSWGHEGTPAPEEEDVDSFRDVVTSKSASRLPPAGGGEAGCPSSPNTPRASGGIPSAMSFPSGVKRSRRISWKQGDETIPDPPQLQSELDGGRRGDDPLLLDGRDLDDPALDELIDLPAELPPPPDGGWGWMIVLASFLANMVVDGIAYSFSPFLPVYTAYFSAETSVVSWISSLLAGVYLSAGPIVSALSNKYGCRRVCMAGAVVGCVAFLFTVFARSPAYLMVVQGVVGGFGFGMMYLPAVVCVGYYFEKRRALATGIAVCGSGVGTMLFPPCVKYLLTQYNWKGTNILLAGLILNGVVCGALMRPLAVPRMTKRQLLQRLDEEERQLRASLAQGMDSSTACSAPGRKRSSGNADPGVQSRLSLGGAVHSGATIALPTIREGGVTSGHNGSKAPDERALLAEADGPKVSIASLGPLPRNCSQPAMWGHRRFMPSVGSVPNFERRRSRTELVNQLKVVPATPRASSYNLAEVRTSPPSHPSSTAPLAGRKASAPAPRGMMLRPMSRQDIFYSGSISNLQEYKSQSSLMSYRESTLNLQGTGASRAVLDVIEGPELEGLDSRDAAPPPEKCSCLPEAMRGTLTQMVDLSLLKDPVFLLIGVANVFGMLGFYTPYVYLPGAAEEKGIDGTRATFLISIIGITNTVGRVLSGLLADMERVNALYVNNLCVLCSGLCVFLTPFATSYASFVVLSIFFGFFVSPFIALTSIILVGEMGLQRLSSAFGVLCIFRGVAGVLSSPLAGGIYDSTKSYDVSFYCAGVLLFVCAGLHCLVPLARRCTAHHQPVLYKTNTDIEKDNFSDNRSEGQADGAEDVGAREGAGITIDIGPKKDKAGLAKIDEAV